MFDRARLAAGETLLVHGGTSGIGLATIQLAKAFGATVITTAGSAEKVAFCRDIGADHAIDYRTQDFEAEVARITGKRGVDVILDMVGGDYVAEEPQMPGARGPAGADRLPEGQPHRGRLEPHHAAPAHGHRLDASREPVRAQGRARARAAPRSVAAVRAWRAEDGDPRVVLARGGAQGACADGVVAAHRQDHARRQARIVGITGGAWVPDMLLNRDSTRYDYEMHLCRNSNINLVRIWGGGVTPCDEFWEAADRYGMLVWSDFWITGDTQGEFKGSPDWPLEGDVFKKNVDSTIYRIRNHPSLLVWTGGNEGHARRELYDFMRNSIIELDGTRPYIPSSSGFAKLPEGWPGSWPDNLPTGVYSGGPYTWQDPKSYYTSAIAGRDWVFKDETGIPSMVTWDILPKIIPNLVWDKTLPFPLNNSWGYHDAATGNGKWDLYYKEMVKRYGEPSSMEDFCNKMQLMNAIGYQGIFEAAGHKLNDIGGVMLWKLNAAFPSVVWQVYDWYLQPNAGYYFMQNACEPLHIQLNLSSLKVTVLNRKYKTASNLAASVQIYLILIPNQSLRKRLFSASVLLKLKRLLLWNLF